jgi:Ser/Thr protein kinase RdoA (MazF antagonist)
MDTNPLPNAVKAARQFQLPGEIQSAQPYGSGHINDTFCVLTRHRDASACFILQRINPRIFENPDALMENIQRVTSHLAEQLIDHPDRDRRVPALISTREGKSHHVDTEGNPWRMYRFIPGAKTYDAVQSTQQAFQAASAFGNFQRQLANLPPPRLHDTIPDFHHTPKRFAALERAIQADAVNRAIKAGPEIAFALARKPITSVLLDADLPERVTHNDTKFNNVLLDDQTGEAICVIDLDTVMPGLALYDFGDMVRTTTSPSVEDEQDLSKVSMQFPMFEALLRGYLSTAGSFLTSSEKSLLAFAGKLITFEMGIRFLADYLAGDVYYKIHRPTHNLDRARTQFKLVQSIEAQEDSMQRLVESTAVPCP